MLSPPPPSAAPLGFFLRCGHLSLVLSIRIYRIVFYFLVLSCPVLSYLVLSCPILGCLVLSCLVLSCSVVSCPVLSCLVLSCHVRIETFLSGLRKPLSDERRDALKEAFAGLNSDTNNGGDKVRYRRGLPHHVSRFGEATTFCCF